MFANIVNLTSNVIFSEKNLPLSRMPFTKIIFFTLISRGVGKRGDQLTLFKPGGGADADYAPHTTSSPHPRIQKAIYTSD